MRVAWAFLFLEVRMVCLTMCVFFTIFFKGIWQFFSIFRLLAIVITENISYTHLLGDKA